jgi:hypothetical protein
VELRLVTVVVEEERGLEGEATPGAAAEHRLGLFFPPRYRQQERINRSSESMNERSKKKNKNMPMTPPWFGLAFFFFFFFLGVVWIILLFLP